MLLPEPLPLRSCCAAQLPVRELQSWIGSAWAVRSVVLIRHGGAVQQARQFGRDVAVQEALAREHAGGGLDSQRLLIAP